MVNIKQIVEIQRELETAYEKTRQHPDGWEEVIYIGASEIKAIIDAINELLTLRDMMIEKVVNEKG